MSWARSVSSRSGPSGPSPNSISTAPRGSSASSGGMNRVRSCDGDRAGGLLDRPQPVGQARLAVVTGPAPEVLVDQVDQLVDGVDAAGLRRSATSPSASTKHEYGQPADPRELVGALEVAAGVGERGVGRRRLSRASSSALPGLGVAGVDAEDGDLVAVLLVERPGSAGISSRHGAHQDAQRLTTIGPAQRGQVDVAPPPRQGRVSSGSAPPPRRRAAGLDAGLGLELRAAAGCRRRPCAGPGLGAEVASSRATPSEHRSTAAASASARAARLMRGPRS